MILVQQGEIECQHTVHFPKQEKSEPKLRKLQLKKRLSPTLSSEAEEIMRSE
jgi:hypothetical protein